MQALWVLNSTRNASEALASPINVSAPNIKVHYLLFRNTELWIDYKSTELDTINELPLIF